MKINIKYLFAFFLMFIIEVVIVLYIHDAIIRPYIGDALVIILIYSFIKSFVPRYIRLLPLYIFLFSTFIEICQYFNLIYLLHLENNTILRIAIGSTFDIKDIFCYFTGTMLLYLWQKYSVSH